MRDGWRRSSKAEGADAGWPVVTIHALGSQCCRRLHALPPKPPVDPPWPDVNYAKCRHGFSQCTRNLGRILARLHLLLVCKPPPEQPRRRAPYSIFSSRAWSSLLPTYLHANLHAALPPRLLPSSHLLVSGAEESALLRQLLSPGTFPCPDNVFPVTRGSRRELGRLEDPELSEEKDI